MKGPKHNAEGYRVICIILVIIVGICIWQWRSSEQNRIKLSEELEAAKAYDNDITYLIRDIHDMSSSGLLIYEDGSDDPDCAEKLFDILIDINFRTLDGRY